MCRPAAALLALGLAYMSSLRVACGRGWCVEGAITFDSAWGFMRGLDLGLRRQVVGSLLLRDAPVLRRQPRGCITSTPPCFIADVCVFPTHTQGGDPGILSCFEVRVKAFKGCNRQHFKLFACFHLTSHNMECFCVFLLGCGIRVCTACRISGCGGRSVSVRGRLRGLEGDLSEF